ncbi:hypothetical protein [uncultured Tateyamaria sp.]|uniref:hypothetical protein n=1 Tax=uncultured Tateyamaria sp. TaxID=455651 RepID=UPI002604B064|nr:hypothetical protein [uncultured Tateyamaria sp.]
MNLIIHPEGDVLAQLARGVTAVRRDCLTEVKPPLASTLLTPPFRHAPFGTTRSDLHPVAR